MRVAFLTPEYPTELPDAGGLGAYVHRFARLLHSAGHQPEVFVPSAGPSGMLSHDGVAVFKVNWAERHLRLRHVHAALARRWRGQVPAALLRWMLQAWALADGMEARHAEAPYCAVQSADYLATGLFVRRSRGRAHVIRCSSAADLYSAFDGTSSILERYRGMLERLAMRKADAVYAPSRFLAEHFLRVHHMSLRIIRPPSFLETEPAPRAPFPLPHRFFLHFGQLMERKGTEVLARALPLAWRAAPDLTMVWVGRCWDDGKLTAWRALWGTNAERVDIRPPVPRAELYAIVKCAEASVLPSQVDNLPNTVIESLMLGTPVLGTRGASIDELVDEGRNGHLVARGDPSALAEALVRMWTRATPVSKGFAWNTGIAEDMRPQRALASFVDLVRHSARRAAEAERINEPDLNGRCEP